MASTLLFLFFMLPATVFLGAHDVLVRRLVKSGEVNEQTLLAVNFIGAGIMLLPALFFFGIPEIRVGFWSAFSATVALNVISQLAWVKAFRNTDASLISPLRLLTPPLVLITGFFILAETPSPIGIAGVLTTIAGLWFLLQSEANFKKIDVRTLFRDKGILFGLAGAVLFAFSFPFDKKAVVSSSALFATTFAFLALGAISFLISIAASHSRNSFAAVIANKKLFFSLIIVQGFGAFFANQALNYSLAAYAASVKRLWSLWAVILSGRFLKEENIGKKVIATLVMIGGVVITVLFG